MVLQLPEILLLLLIFQLVFISTFLFAKRTGKKWSNNLLGLFFLCIGLALTDNFLIRTGIGYTYPNAVMWSSAFPLLYGPLLYFYTQSLLYKARVFKTIRFLHFIPFMVLSAVALVSYAVQPENVKLETLRTINLHHIASNFYWFTAVIFCHFLFYALLAIKLIRQYRVVALNKFADIQRINIQWLHSTILFFICLFILSVLNNVFEAGNKRIYYSATLSLIIVALLVFITRVLFKALQNQDMFGWMDEEDEIITPKVVSPPPGRTDELNLLKNYMISQKPYLNPGLTVESLATAIRMRPKELSLIINENLGQNFFDYINRYRIEEAKLLLEYPKDEKTTVLEVLYEVGFNSKSSFNVLFKKYTGLTPTEFKNQTKVY